MSVEFILHWLHSLDDRVGVVLLRGRVDHQLCRTDCGDQLRG